MSSITAQQTKLDLELVPKENRLDIRKCNGRIPHGLTPREPTFQVILDTIALTLFYHAFLITTDVPEGRSIHSMMLLSIRCIKPGELLLLLSTEKIQENLSKKSLTKPATGIVIREPHVETKSKRKEKVDVTRSRGIELLYELALTKEAQMKEVRKKSLRDLHKLHPSGSGTVAEKPPRVDKITFPVISEGTGDKPRVPDVTKDESTKSESESWGNNEDDGNDENDSKNEGNDDENKSDDDKTPFDSEKDSDFTQDTDGSNKDRGMDDTTNQLSDDVQDKKVDDEMTNAQQEKENLIITQEQVVEDAHVTIMTVAKEFEVPDASASSQTQSTYEAVATLTEFELKKILIDKMNSSKSYLTAPKHWECYDGLIMSYNLDKDFFSSYDVYSLKRSRQDKDKGKGPFAGSDRGFKKRKTRKDAKPTTSLKNKDSTSNSSKGTKSQIKSSGKSVHSKEPKFEENPEGGDYPFDLSKPLPLITRGNYQSVPVEFIINNDLKNLQVGISTMTYTTSTTKTKVTQEQRKSFYAYARGKQSRGDVYFTKHIMAVTHVLVIRKHGYGYLEEIVVRRADNVLYKFKEGDHNMGTWNMEHGNRLLEREGMSIHTWTEIRTWNSSW
uniref:Uncharacterized protein n=1 Tax=Tanacetum cinerariifolium TaxID=118510 RepID=A0A6L2MJJ9_TANCI|nr:hypothetical protein [Tanacetum cinerariifolium]